MKTKIVSVTILACGRRVNEMARQAGLFERWKRLMHPYELEFAGPTNETIDLFAIKDKLEAKGFLVTAIWDNQDTSNNWVDWSVKVISDGSKWCLLRPMLETYGIEEVIRPTSTTVVRAMSSSKQAFKAIPAESSISYVCPVAGYAMTATEIEEVENGNADIGGVFFKTAACQCGVLHKFKL